MEYKLKELFFSNSITDYVLSPLNDFLIYINTNMSGFENNSVLYTQALDSNKKISSRGRISSLAISNNGNLAVIHRDKENTVSMKLLRIWKEKYECIDTIGLLEGNDDYLLNSNSISKSGRFIAISSPRGNFQNIFIYDLSNGRIMNVTKDTGCFEFGLWCPEEDEKFIILEYLSNINQNIWIINLRDGTKTKIFKNDQSKCKVIPIAWNSKGIFFLTNHGKEFMAIGCLNTANFKWRYLISEQWDVEDFSISKNEKFLAWVVNENGCSKLYIINLFNGKQLPIRNLPLGVIKKLKFSLDSYSLFFIFNTFEHPDEIYKLDLINFQLVKVTNMNKLPKCDFVQPLLYEVKGEDGCSIPFFWYKKPQSSQELNNLSPILFSIHGGPELQERPYYNFFYQYLIKKGISIIAPNIRGSTGYGPKYQKQIYRDWGGIDLKDIGMIVKHVKYEQKSPLTLGVFGHSYGGYVALNVITRMPSIWKCASIINAPSNLFAFTSNYPDRWRPIIKQWLGDPVEDYDFLIERSPYYSIENINCALQLHHGVQDLKVPVYQTDQLVKRLRMLKKKYVYHRISNEGHNFSESALINSFSNISRFLLLKLQK